MSILLHADTRVIIQGITGEYAARQTQAMLRYGTRIVAGVTPGRGGSSVHGVPVYDTMAEALADHPAEASAIYAGTSAAPDAVREALAGNMRLIFVTGEGLPARDVMLLRALTRRQDAWMIGPNSLGLISPGRALLGAFAPEWALPGRLGILSRGGTLMLRCAGLLTEHGIGYSTAAHIGGDNVLGRNPVEYLRQFEADPDTSAVLLISEVGGTKDDESAAFIATMKKPVVALVVGHHAPRGKAMGHAGAIIGSDAQTAAAKEERLAAAGARIARAPEDLPGLLQGLL